MKKNYLRNIALIMGFLTVILGGFIFLKANNDMVKVAESYLKENYEDVKFTYIKTIKRIDGNISEVKFKTENSDLEYSVFIRNKKIYDNYLRTDIEHKIKEIVFKSLDKQLEKESFDVYLNMPFEEDYKLKNYKENFEGLEYDVVVYHDTDFDRNAINERYSKLANKIFINCTNVENLIVKNYEKKDIELYFEIEKNILNSDFTVKNIKKYLEDKEIIYKN